MKIPAMARLIKLCLFRLLIRKSPDFDHTFRSGTLETNIKTIYTVDKNSLKGVSPTEPATDCREFLSKYYKCYKTVTMRL